MATVGERDRARGSETREDPSIARLQAKAAKRRERTQERASHGKPPALEDEESMADIIDRENAAAYEAGRKAGGASSSLPQPPAPARARSSSSSSSSSSGGALRGPAVPGVTLPMVIDIAIITADEVVNQHRLPIPSRLLAAFLLFGTLGAIKGEGARPAKAFAWAIVIATFYGNSPGKKPAALSALEALGGFLGGKYGTNNASAAGPSSSSSGATTG